jgi:hypothetical protein
MQKRYKPNNYLFFLIFIRFSWGRADGSTKSMKKSPPGSCGAEGDGI